MKFLCMSLCAVMLCSYCSAQVNFNFFISNNGSDSNSGANKLIPKRTISAAYPDLNRLYSSKGSISIGFQNNSVFNETLKPAFPVQVGSYFDNPTNKNFAIFNGTAVFDSGWQKVDSMNHVFQQAIPLNGFKGYGINGVGQYSMVYVFEIDKALEKTAPITARKVLTFVNSLQASENSAGSFFETVSTDENPKAIYIHTSDGNSPNNNGKYRYEVTVRDWAINSTYEENNHFERLWIRGYGAGNGMIPSGANSSFNRMIFGPGAGIHHLGLRGATINNSLFLPGAKNTNGYAVVFYDVEGFGRHNTISNSIFMDIKYPIYTHKSYGSNFGALELDNVIAFADTTESQSFLETSDNDTVLMNNVYVDRYPVGYNYGKAKYVNIRNSNFINVARGISFPYKKLLAAINNCFIKTSNTGVVYGITISDSNNLFLSNTIVHLKSESNSVTAGTQGAFVAGTGGVTNYIEATGNVFICDVPAEKNVIAATSIAIGAVPNGDRWNNNVYVLLRGQKFVWKIGTTQLSNFAEWQRQSGQDKQSLFFDLRKDARGLKAIFTDPDHGDYSLANTLEGNQVKKIRAGMTNPISCFLPKPTYEYAANIIMHDAVLTANACRSPCEQRSIRGNYDFNSSLSGAKMVQLQWHISDERNLDHYELLRSFGTTDFVTIRSIEAEGKPQYSIGDSSVQPGIEYRYSLVLVTKTGDRCYSGVSTIKVNDGKSILIYPNPSPGKIMITMNGYEGPLTIAVTDCIGKQILNKKTVNVYGTPATIDLAHFSKGLYWVRITSADKSFLQSILLQ